MFNSAKTLIAALEQAIRETGLQDPAVTVRHLSGHAFGPDDDLAIRDVTVDKKTNQIILHVEN